MTSKQTPNISEAKLARLLEYNSTVKEKLDISILSISEASTSIIDFCNRTLDPLVPSVWGVQKRPALSPSGDDVGCCAII
ncbi:G-protein gamma subunit [Pilobolus umbonatus]|nr:G-protein gamma subunit [Pilobolus umbonatus]